MPYSRTHLEMRKAGICRTDYVEVNRATSVFAQKIACHDRFYQMSANYRERGCAIVSAGQVQVRSAVNASELSKSGTGSTVGIHTMVDQTTI